MKEKLLAAGLMLGVVLSPAALEVSAQAQVPKPSPAPAAPKPAVVPAAPAVVPKPAPAPTPAPRAGGFPMELALPLMTGGAAALGGGVYLLRRGKRRE